MSILNDIIFEAKRFAPSIFAGAGIMTIGISCFEACKATYLHLDDIIAAHEEDMEDIKERDDKDRKRDTTAVYKRTCCDLAKLYILPTAGIIFGIGLMLEGQNILDQRLTAATAATATVQKAFEDYRERMIKKGGKELDEYGLTGKEEVEVKKKTVDENGKTKTVKEKYTVMDPKAVGKGYMKYITKSNPYWNDDPYMMDTMFTMEQNYLNEMFRINRKLVLSQVYDRFGILENEYDPDAMVMGWLEGVGDQHIEIKWDRVKLPNEDGEYIDAYAVDFNVQCNVYTTIRRRNVLAMEKEAA